MYKSNLLVVGRHTHTRHLRKVELHQKYNQKKKKEEAVNQSKQAAITRSIAITIAAVFKLGMDDRGTYPKPKKNENKQMNEQRQHRGMESLELTTNNAGTSAPAPLTAALTHQQQQDREQVKVILPMVQFRDNQYVNIFNLLRQLGNNDYDEYASSTYHYPITTTIVTQAPHLLGLTPSWEREVMEVNCCC